ncbi:MAG TPA: hypothetical protein VGL78_04290 [Solirubrobacteraceae bacterium]|jgi:hypothetical protein
MSKRLSTIIVVLAIASAESHSGSWWTLLLPLALVLYPFSLSFLVAARLSPFILVYVAWLVWRRLRDGKFPDSFTSEVKRLRNHRIFKHPVFGHRVFSYRLRVERRP